MSIVAAAATSQWVFDAAWVVACLAAGVPLAVGWVKPSRLDGADRLPPGQSAWSLVTALALGLLVWLMVPAFYLDRGGAATRGEGGFDISKLPARDMAFLAVVPPLAALGVLLTADRVIYRGRLAGLGLSISQAARGLPAGLLRGLAVVPLVFAASVLSEWVYRATGYHHPPEHELLRAVGASTSPAVRALLIAGAVVIAPMFEELLFRGHLQTILRRAFVRLLEYFAGSRVDHRPAVPGEIAIVAAPPGDPRRAVVATWLAILLTSAAFASVHAVWTWVPIFLLSLCLGYAYERSGNLWTSVGIHAAFNGVSTVIFLLFGGSN